MNLRYWQHILLEPSGKVRYSMISVIMNNLRNRLYKFSLNAGLFFFIPLTIKMPERLQRLLLRCKAFIRFTFGSYRAYVNRQGLRDIAIKNISQTLKLEDSIARKRIQDLMYLEVIAERNGFLLDNYDLSTLKDQFVVRGLETLDRELEKKKGIIFITIHAGDTVLFVLFLSLLGYDIYGLFDGAIIKGDSSDPLLRLGRLKDSKITGKIGKLYTDKGLWELFNVLKNNGIIGWMIDLPPQSMKRMALVNFLGTEICINKSFLDVALKSGASLVPFIDVYDLKEHKHIVFIGKPFDLQKEGLQEIYAFFEPYVRKNPESWLGWYFFDMLKRS